ncbi:aminotransferase class V-fold PLP-dependent enzyme [Estrella lausannensis]|uniref:Aminotransferase n=1 Tax=Estrella lausannensis TaxID=483423 RepID=A0A0H5DP62_9BACT|nr:aminotransferase class V-fold PLP-dependent enzyme [Estrella lausannensis]CRX38286.1 Aminotransferase [Estrella lausannensis]
MSLNIAKLRKETPGCLGVVHFNNAGASLMPKSVINAVNSHFEMESALGGYEAADNVTDKIAGFYDAAAKLIHGSPGEIAYQESATRAWDMVFYSLSFKPGDRILTSRAEYASNYIAFLQVVKKTGAIIDIIPDDVYGQLSLDALEKMISPSVKLIAITHVPTQGGLINPAEAVGKIAKAHGIFYLLDATQSVGQMPIDVEAMQCDALCATGRKFLRGPRGTGFLYVRASKIAELEPPFLDLHAATWEKRNRYAIRPDARRFETWERNYANMLGLKAAIEYALTLGMPSIWERIKALSKTLRMKLGAVEGVVLRDLGENKCGIVSFTVEGMDAARVMASLRVKNIHVSVSLAEYAPLDLGERGLDSVVRASLHCYNTEEEIELFIKHLRDIAGSVSGG